MDFWKAFLVMCVSIVVKSQDLHNETETDFDLEDITNTTEEEAFSSSSSTEENKINITDTGDIIFTRGPTEENTMKPDLSSTSVPETTVKSFDNETATIGIETNWTACSLMPCKNGGTCLDDPFNSFVYTCACKNGFIGNRCSIKDDCSVAKNSDLCSMGACVYSTDRNSRSCECFFGKHWDEIKKECREPEPPCFPNPCQNNGNCEVQQEDRYKCNCLPGYEGDNCEVRSKCGKDDICDNGKCVTIQEDDLKMCECKATFYWNEEAKRCEEVAPPCIPNPCSNNGQCEVLPNGEFNCTCLGHFIDKVCDIPDNCYSSIDDIMCGGYGICHAGKNSSTCICSEGYYFDDEAKTCREIKAPCFPNPCSNDGLCTPYDSSDFNCTCSEEYKGPLCEQPDFCVLQGGNAKCGDAACKSDSNLGTFHCQCEEGHYFDFASWSCPKIDFCPLMSCGENEECIDSTCTCQENFKRNNNTGNCDANYCLSNPCPIKEMNCVEGIGIMDYRCFCSEGHSFDGKHCKEDSCVFPQLNDCEQVCETSGESYVCQCHEDHFELKENNKTCQYTGNSTCSNKTCDKGTCFEDDENVERCICPPGYEELEGKCVDLCSSGHLPDGYCPDNKCEATASGFRCKCEGKYTLSEDKVTCTNRRVCQKGEIGWTTCASKNGTCVEDWNTDSGYKCRCSAHQFETVEGICQDACNDEEYQRKCYALGAKCHVGTDGNRMCRCPPLYQTPKDGKSCGEPGDFSYLLTMPLDLDTYAYYPSNERIMKRSVQDKTSVDYFRVESDIEKSMTKIFPELSDIKVVTCDQNANYFLCKAELQFISITPEKLKRLQNPGLCLTNEKSTDKCLFPPSLVLRKERVGSDLVVKKTDPCDEDVKLELCGSETICSSSDVKSFNCTCGNGYSVREKKFPFTDSNSFIEICNDIDECLEMNSCPPYSTCHNTMGSFTCSCIPGYRKKEKSSDPKQDGCVEICNPNPCDHGTCEKEGDNGFECKCEAGFAGALCDLRDENFKYAHTNTIIVGAVLGGALLVTIILFITTVLRLKRKKYQEDPDHVLYATEMTERRGGAINNAYQSE